jgi:superfamily II DNA or RNA helicase
MALPKDPLKWINFRLSPSISKESAERQRQSARAIIKHLYAQKSPGVILADEVGMGKTYEAFGVLAGLFVHCPKAKVVIFTHSRNMARVWKRRWDEFRKRAIHNSSKRLLLPSGVFLNNSEDIGRQGVYFGSYETAKCVSKSDLRAALELCLEGRGIHENPTRRNLREDLFGTKRKWKEKLTSERKPSQSAMNRFWKYCYDPEAQRWKYWSRAEQELRRIVFQTARTRKKIDLLVVDEAHKLAGRQRNLFFSEVINGRASRVLYVTATPFALDVYDLYERIVDMHHATGLEPKSLQSLFQKIERFRDIVRFLKQISKEFKEEVKKSLGHYLIRSLWEDQLKPGVQRRIQKTIGPKLQRAQGDRQTFATLGLETAFLRLEEEGRRAHLATHRETLCSSYRAIRDAAQKRSEEDRAWPLYLKNLPELLSSRKESPKFEAVLQYLIKSARSRQKVVVFCKRLATIREFRRRLNDALRGERLLERNRWKQMQSRLRGKIEPSLWPRLRLSGSRGRTIPSGKEKAALAGLANLLKKSGEPTNGDEHDTLWNESWGPGRHIDWVGVLSGETRQSKGKGRSPEAVQFAFNLPGPPYILLCTQVAREGIDLHLWCRKVIQYDLEWNPAFMEQQVGRIDRMGSLSRREGQPIEVYYAWQEGTYEEHIAKIVEERVEIMRVLLGAGEWLQDSPKDHESISRLKEYALDFSP